MKKIIAISQMKPALVTLLQGGVSKGLNESRIRLISEVIKAEYDSTKPISVEVICFDSGREGRNKYICDKMYNLHNLRGTVVGIKI